jgi:hypothetical protein
MVEGRSGCWSEALVLLHTLDSAQVDFATD